MTIASHSLPVRVYYEDTDAGGIVYHTSYLRFAERGRTEFMRESGLDHSALLAEQGLLLVVRRCEVDFLAPARLDDLLDLHTELLEVGGARLLMRQTVRRADQALVVILVTVVTIGADGRVRRITPGLRQILAAGPASPVRE